MTPRLRSAHLALPASLHPPSPLRKTSTILRLMRIRADKSAVGAVNRPLQAIRYVRLPITISYTYFASQGISNKGVTNVIA